ncbi:572_t:CDS:2 [Entrophospora sp. SA101]|nr:572_t:CDS:2 [Entrophospora sp. SA101]
MEARHFYNRKLLDLTFGTEYAITHTDDIILQTFAPTFDSLLESYDPFQIVTSMEATK